jgi:hypothetical protein
MYLAINAVAATAGFVIIYGLTFLLPALARRYWRWPQYVTDHGGGKRRADHARRRLKLIRMAIATAHARSHATTAMSRFEGKIKNHAAKAQQRNVRSFQPAPPGPVSRTRVNGARTMAKNPIIRTLSLSS